jgi:2-polyprenyl-6-methoxyphenol hydroxylase-like FAD-dependent oxidoreductase
VIAVRPEDLPTADTDVLVVGAGPTGLMAGLVLACTGLMAVVADQKSGPTRESRALAVQPRTMEIYDQLGLAERVISGAYRAVRMQIGDREPASGGVGIDRVQQGATRFPGIQIFEQSRNEELLSAALTESGREILWGHRLIDLVDATSEPDGRVVALLEGPDGLMRVRARWCIGADGASSAVRRILDVPFEGVTDEATFWVADVRGLHGLPEQTMTMRFGKSTFGLTFPLGPGGHARLVSLALDDHVDQDAALASAHDDLGLAFDSVDWFSSYRVHHRVASRFRVGSVFLAGDAAHVHSPVGGQGMNTGLQDAHNLALLLTDIARGHLGPVAVDRYEHERRPVAVTLVKVTDRMFGIIGRRGTTVALLRRLASASAAGLAPRLLDTRVGARLGGYLGQYRIRYHYLPKGSRPPAWADDQVVGLRLPPAGDNHQALRRLTWQLHTYGTQADRPDLPDWIEDPQDFGRDKHQHLSPDRLYLVRPDGFIAASLPLHAKSVDRTQLRAALAAHDIKH